MYLCITSSPSVSICIDTVSGFSFHPYLPMAATSSGHRRFWVHDDAEDELDLSGIP